ncbi:hypothetical protein [Colwellia piezophila]|uniref:hypothetical protein n=1 Tax=Colwellia piezophila TaxID=211668 RepID=UPI00035EE1D1|nr:hypothetical protein [Colwellia piezophila]
MSHKATLFPLILLITFITGCTTVSSDSDMKTLSATIPSSVLTDCTTNASTFFETSLRTNEDLGNDEKRSAILKSIGISTSNPNFAVKTFKGQWFLEFETPDAIYVSYKVRSHYLQVAVFYTPRGLDTIICNSRNLKQSDSSIHKKAPIWKESLNSRIRSELSQLTYPQQKS